ncbi:hypothetical protein MKZ38_008818 [Zalerion maritima]|uniref:Uncharacterized protein n=1 Tax=Zalerion maritima TaxID=339359 RepID=A0AAD5WVE6_9PEZI|nr:hypothetical protein MKZ38_008818 [Zalerion maritima]
MFEWVVDLILELFDSSDAPEEENPRRQDIYTVYAIPCADSLSGNTISNGLDIVLGGILDVPDSEIQEDGHHEDEQDDPEAGPSMERLEHVSQSREAKGKEVVAIAQPKRGPRLGEQTAGPKSIRVIAVGH